MITMGLVIGSPWIEKILAGEKTWEIRGTPNRRTGRIALCKKGGLIVATCTIGASYPLTSKAFLESMEKHCVSPPELKTYYAGKQVYAWPLSDVRKIDAPIDYEHSGGGSWVKLSRKHVREWRRLQKQA
jgi:hypothetical protein